MTLEGRRLAIGHGRRVIGRDIDIVLHPGEAVALLGPNGGGKTTLLKTLIGLIPPHAGEVEIGGRKLMQLSARERARLVAYVPQIHIGTFAFSVETVVLMGRTAHMPLFAKPSPRDREATRAALERLGIEALAARRYTEISGGERQLVLLARALAQQPRFVVLDEPTANLDFGNQGRVTGEIRALAQAGLGVLFTTHDPNQALRIAARVYLMRHGHCVAHGPVQDMLTRERLEAVYDAPIRVLSAASGTAFLPA